MSGQHVKLSVPVKARLEQMQQEDLNRIGRKPTFTELLERLIAEHDRNKQEAAGA